MLRGAKVPPLSGEIDYGTGEGMAWFNAEADLCKLLFWLRAAEKPVVLDVVFR